ncbi:RB6I2 protein, partial [Polypterus senegalus]
MTIQALQDELRIQRDLNQLFQQDSSNRASEPLTSELTEENYQRLHTEHERQAKELFLLRKTLEEMELRIDTQKQTLAARDESIKKLLEMLQSKGLSAKATEEDHERTRRLAEAEMHVHHLESLLDQKEKETAALREELHRRYEGAPESAKTKALQTVIEMKDTKINSLERGLRDLEEEVQILKSNGALSTEEREEEIKQMEVYRSHSKFMKNKVEQLKKELNLKDAQGEELRKRVAGLQLEVDALRLRLEEKETMLNKKTKQIQEMAEEKGTLNGEIHDLKDMLDVKERKVNVLQKKIENLQEQLRDKEKQMTSLKERVKSLQADTSNTDTALATLEEALAEKNTMDENLSAALELLEDGNLMAAFQIHTACDQLDSAEKAVSFAVRARRMNLLRTSSLPTDVQSPLVEVIDEGDQLFNTVLQQTLAQIQKTRHLERIIERLKEQRDRDEREKTEEIENTKKELKELREKVSTLQGDLSDKETSLLDLKEHASSLASSGLKKDSKLKSLEISLEQKKEECIKLEMQLKKAHEATVEARANTELSERIHALEKEVARYKEEASKSQAEVDRLLEILREMENEKNDKDKKILELERYV